MGNLVFDARSVAPSVAGQGQLPASDENGHHVKITDTQVKPVKDQSGGYLAVMLTIASGEHAGASGVKRFNLYNQSQKAVEIAYQELSALCYSIGRISINSHEDLRGGECRAIVQPQADPKYTEVKGFKDVNGNAPDVIAKAVAAGQAPPANQPAANPGGFAQQPQQPAQNAGWANPAAGQPDASQGQQGAAWQNPAAGQPVSGVPVPGQQQGFNPAPAQPAANGVPAWATPK